MVIVAVIIVLTILIKNKIIKKYVLINVKKEIIIQYIHQLEVNVLNHVLELNSNIITMIHQRMKIYVLMFVLNNSQFQHLVIQNVVILVCIIQLIIMITVHNNVQALIHILNKKMKDNIVLINVHNKFHMQKMDYVYLIVQFQMVTQHQVYNVVHHVNMKIIQIIINVSYNVKVNIIYLSKKKIEMNVLNNVQKVIFINNQQHAKQHVLEIMLFQHQVIYVMKHVCTIYNKKLKCVLNNVHKINHIKYWLVDNIVLLIVYNLVNIYL